MDNETKQPTVSNPLEHVVMWLWLPVKIPFFLLGVLLCWVCIPATYYIDIDHDKKFTKHCINYTRELIKILTT